MLKPYRDPYGFRKLLAFQKAEQAQICCGQVTRLFPKTKTLLSLADQMDRSARSGKQNIVEGWKRNTTKEYYDFLGFSIGAIAELEEDCNDIWKGFYADLMGITGIMGERGEMGLKGRSEMGKMGNVEIGIMGERGIKKGDVKNENRAGEMGAPLNPLTPLVPFAPLLDIEKLKFYPLDEKLPPIVKLKLRCKELNFLLHKLQQSLLEKMEQEKTLPIKDKLKISEKRISDSDDEYLKILEKSGLEKLADGRIVKKV
jgi:four helix bundle protein